MLFSKPGLPLKIALAMALSVGSTSAALANSAAACQAGQAGCVIPVQDTVVATTVDTTPVYVDEDSGGGFGLLPILALLAAAAAILYFTVLDDDEEAISP